VETTGNSNTSQPTGRSDKAIETFINEYRQNAHAEVGSSAADSQVAAESISATEEPEADAGAFDNSNYIPRGSVSMLRSSLVETPEQRFKAVRGSMGGLQRWLLDRSIGRMTRAQTEKFAARVFDAELEAITHKLALGLSVEKMEIFVAYLRSTAHVRCKLQALEANSRAEMSKMLATLDGIVFETRKANSDTIRKQLKRGLLTEPEAEEEYAKFENLLRKDLKQNLETLDQLRESMRESLRLSMQVYFNESFVIERSKAA